MLGAKNLIALICGILFALGLGVSGMTQPQKIVDFLDLFGNWDASLVFVMIGAIAVHSVSFYFIKKRQSPLLQSEFFLPDSSKLSKRLIIGAAIFGIGWGISGFCPGPGLTSLFSGHSASFTFVGSMIVGMVFFNLINPYLLKK